MTEETNPYLDLIQELFKDLLQRADQWEEERRFGGEELVSVDIESLREGIKKALSGIRREGMPALTEEETRDHRHVYFNPNHVKDPGATTIGGKHMSPADTDPDMGATGRRAKGEEA